METPNTLRIACLEPSATAICLALGLGHHIVGVTHECRPVLSSYSGSEEINGTPRVLTKSGLTVDSQADIHAAIQETSKAAAAVVACRIGSNGSINGSDYEEVLITNDVPSLYPLVQEELEAAEPTIIFTQDLCSVCAPTTTDVRRCLLKRSQKNNGSMAEVSIVSLQPTTLYEVADTYVTVAEACDVPERGHRLKDEFLSNLQRLKQVIEASRDSSKSYPKLFILEWLDPPFDSGHWTYQLMDYACVVNARPKSNHKAMAIEWKDVYSTDPDLVIVGCCGFDLERNVRDTLAKADKLKDLRAAHNNRIYASDGDRYIAQPAPSLLQGVVLLAQCAYQNEPNVLDAIAELGYETMGWQAVDVTNTTTCTTSDSDPEVSYNLLITDMEDLVKEGDGFARLHRDACEKGELTYIDLATGYSVFTEIAHKQRGKCCGSGCRHCPYSHENVADKAAKIQQPAILYRQSTNNAPPVFSVDSNKNMKVLFFSGGKDSFLTIRSLVRSYMKDGPFGLILLTTFDATTRVIAHQEVNIDDVIKQASHLDITLVGVPLRRGSGETYADRIRGGLNVIKGMLPSDCQLSLVFGDLHLGHIKEWRDKILTQLDCNLEYPLWKVPYSDLLEDLEASRVPCIVSGSSREEVKVGTLFDRTLYTRLVDSGIDGFGEAGEFHSLAMVFEVPRTVALGLPSDSM